MLQLDVVINYRGMPIPKAEADVNYLSSALQTCVNITDAT